jgi:hypothetical protein
MLERFVSKTPHLEPPISTDHVIGRRKAQAAQGFVDSASGTPAIASGKPCWIESQQAVIWLPTTKTRSLKDTRTPLLPMTAAATQLEKVSFPLTSDHLITLLQYNALRGSMTNRQLLYKLPSLTSQAFESTDLHVFSDLDHGDAMLLPPSLRPTLLQRTVSHEHWIDIIPHPVLRDNFIQATGKYDPDQLWSDSVGGLFEGFPDSETEHRGVVIWEPPWDFRGWELSEGFVRNWAWALKGCEDILVATNSWREKRGEEALVLEV